MNGSWSNFFPYFAGALKIVVLGIGGYLAIKWHFDEEARVREEKCVAFDRSSYMKKMVMILAFLVTVVVLVIYATNWYLD
ncbi:hypothetical protein KW517_14920 [Vibrio fluvialis]|uniref:hypothetical protein n=1 Tax=Vibrio fluvialis TaxID=676 RepID=UPI001C9D02E8|nr:hypothetical protein [Vibrio fluvialis]MBY7931760.1 hypothetical protein [Vibrio fluvialis]MBY8186625.1 hypothetical protein [Vibrio fluvialis]MBY8215311.1 hypothetical protein [Vibrio fluvialis]MCE7655443.1 hypothetical protein [Vibrio fluvialis]BEI24783.1 hypothetical protein KKIDH5335_31150 [Vibrio fluvialis]